MKENNSFYLGIDGGGTKTVFAVADSDLKVIYKKELGPSSIDTVSLEELKKVYLEGLKDIKFPVRAVFAGSGGISSKEGEKEVISILKEMPTLKSCRCIQVGNDTINALYAAFQGGDGIIEIIGTGSVARGKKGTKEYLAGGYSYQEGNEGSAYWLGKKSLEMVSKVLDKRILPNQLAGLVMDEINCHTFGELCSFYMKASRSQIASLAKLVTSHPESKEARVLMDEGIEELALMVKTVYRELNFDSGCLFSIIGSLGNADTYYKNGLLAKLKKELPELNYVPCKEEPFIGAIRKAMKIIS